MPKIEISDKIPDQANAVTDNQTVENHFEYKECPLCNGYGTAICNKCKGNGQIEVKENKKFNETIRNDSKTNNSAYYVTCNACKGKSELISKNCKGEGQIKIIN